MAGYVDRSLIHNSALACFLLASFAKEYQRKTENESHPSFEKLLLVLPIVWHGPSRRSIASRFFDTPIHAVLHEEPRIAEGLADRIAAHAAVSCQGLNLACQTGLLVKREIRDEQVFAFAHEHWPKNSKPTTIPTEMSGTTSRLANWFKDYSAAELFSIFGIN
ncbi:three component ABC system middle component [Paraburkholderia azotifigens]|uniref:three component ABC system middle component n=1 Tax=Paraburkholderia azotifigens TaxID=2057004 RepID=UPI00316E1C07